MSIRTGSSLLPIGISEESSMVRKLCREVPAGLRRPQANHTDAADCEDGKD